MAKMYYEKDTNLELLSGKKVAIVGYGSQGHAHALNLKESGIDVVVGLYNGSKSWKRAEKAGFIFSAVLRATFLGSYISALKYCHNHKLYCRL